MHSMPHKVYHGKTGVVYNVTKSAVGVIVYKKVGNRYIEKRVNLRIEHISLSRSREEFVRRVKTNAQLKKKAKAEGTHIHLKRQPAMPREARTISTKNNVPETVVPIAYETTIWKIVKFVSKHLVSEIDSVNKSLTNGHQIFLVCGQRGGLGIQ